MKKSRVKQSLSVAMATFNEEKNIVDCLDTVQKIADEIVIVDGNSSDRTADLARKMGVKLINKPNMSMFNINKNLAIRNCKSDWILLLDADERVSIKLQNEIVRTINANQTEKGYWINRKNWFLGGFLNKGGVYPDPVIRLFKNGEGILPEVDVHEQVKINGTTGRLTCDLLHLADPSFKRYLERANRYTERTKINLKDSGLKSSSINALYYLIIKPIVIFFLIYFRHKGYQDGFRGFVWALFSGAHFFYAYSKFSTKSQ